MKISSSDIVREMYDASANSYNEMMDAEINLPIYSELLKSLDSKIEGIPGLLVDSSCGSGHMLLKYYNDFDQEREMLGIDLSACMVAIAREKLGSAAKIYLGDMRNLVAVDTGTAAAVISYFAIHHLDPAEVAIALLEWHRVLVPNGHLLLAAWEGVGPINYGDESDIIANKHLCDELTSLAESAGFKITRSSIEPIEELSMDAVYLDAIKCK
jgi:ubiquinone/menaquinone biosynthesis C-methylase UbiE